MDWERLGKKLLFPPVWVMAILSVCSAAALVLIFVKGWEQTVPAYCAYVVAAYTLTIICIYCSIVLPKRFRRIKQRIYDNLIGNRYMTDTGFRTKISLYLGLGINLLYVGVYIYQWHMIGSAWFLVLAAYYVILSAMRFLLVRYVQKNTIGSSIAQEWKRARLCAYILLTVNLSLSSAVLMILYQDKGYHYEGILIYVMAAYTFYMTITAIIDMVRFPKLGSPVMTAAKVIALSAALVSLLTLETAMFSQFGTDMRLEDQRIIIILTGAGISVAVITMSVLLIFHATKEIRRLKNGKTG